MDNQFKNKFKLKMLKKNHWVEAIFMGWSEYTTQTNF